MSTNLNLKQIEISGFKSFAKKSVLDFKTPITAIVGPNGSGKSNVAEAFSFVLGEQSIKSLRGKKGEDLIYNGSASGTRSNRALVKVILDNKKRLLDLDFDEVSIERAVHRDGTNNYSINGSQVRLKDVIEILAGASIGSTGHHIISQGEADRVLNVNPKERKAIIEDALGLKIYQIKRRESEKKLEKTDENIKQVESLRREIKPHLKFLERQAEKIEKTLEMRKSLVSLYQEYFKRENLYLVGAKNYLEKETSEPRELLKRVDSEISKLEQVVGKEKNSSSESKELGDLEDKITQIRQKKGKLILELGRFEGELNSLKKIIESTTSEEGTSKVSLEKIEALIASLMSNLDSLEKEQDISKIRFGFSEIRTLLKEFKAKVFSSRESDSYDSQIVSIEEKIKETEKSINVLIVEERKIKESYDKRRAEIEENKNTGIVAERKIFDLKTQKNEVLLKFSELKSLKEKIEIEDGAFKRELTEAAVLAGREAINFEDFHLSKEEVVNEDRNEQEKRRREIEKITIRLEDSGGSSGEEILKEYEEVKERDAFLEREITDLKKSAESLKQITEELESRVEKEFSEGVEKINNQFQEFFSLMFGGGSASLEVIRGRRVVNPEDDSEGNEDLSDGVEIEVNLPRKKIKGLMMLSGGERALTSIALLFAMSQVNPPPFIILDETDAALDEANSKKYGDMVKNLSNRSQLILITHNRETMSRAGVLYGVTMDSTGVSKLLSVDLEEAAEVAK